MVCGKGFVEIGAGDMDSVARNFPDLTFLPGKTASIYLLKNPVTQFIIYVPRGSPG